MTLPVSNQNQHQSFVCEFWTEEQINLVKNTICPGITEDELKLFFYACKNSGLDPFIKQIYAVKRGTDSKAKMTIQTGIDGYRLIAERSKKYVPGQEPEFRYTKEGRLLSATAFVKKLTSDGTWHVVSATAFYDEYVQLKFDGTPNSMWLKMPRAMLAKCAEALALKKCFPAELSGIYSDEEMSQADNPIIEVDKPSVVVDNTPVNTSSLYEAKPSQDDASILNLVLKDCSPEYKKSIQQKVIDIGGVSKMSMDDFNRILAEAKEEKQKEQVKAKFCEVEIISKDFKDGK